MISIYINTKSKNDYHCIPLKFINPINFFFKNYFLSLISLINNLILYIPIPLNGSMLIIVCKLFI